MIAKNKITGMSTLTNFKMNRSTVETPQGQRSLSSFFADRC